MGDGITAPPGEIKAVGEVLQTLKNSAADIERLAEQADPGLDVWGVGLGRILKLCYDPKAEEAREHIRMIGDALESQARVVTNAAENYERLDQEMAAAFERFLDDLNGR
ncbi:hypothetical protein [Phytomonospora endophytica]|uniref:Excreted virulence factor EspC (Type VII ESX diderm) n=1 Tax=Phytomonospora endophytica TaxID=714109 RepID=A0A841FKD2_9ACTN|nr:hypothetical protein [Phytomonospora endophytica]MBB6034288.1 hypothetical protein [Phytomonospora endophytica]GIG66682.1 hypothetical protein Pen01_29770 [Phytomonospora endophytica]